MTEPRFVDLPTEDRMRRRAILEAGGAEITGYYGAAVQVAIPRGKLGTVGHAAELARLTFVDGSLYLFPLGTDNPPEHMRHDGNYPGSRGFWLYASYRPHAGAMA